MVSNPQKTDAPLVSFLRRNQMNLFGGFCMAGDLLVALRGGFDGNLLIGLGGGSMTVAALASTIGGKASAPVSAPAFTLGGALNLAAGIESIHATGANPASLTQTGLGALWTAAPLAMYLGDRIAADIRVMTRPAGRLLNRILPADPAMFQLSPAGRLGKRLSSATQNQVGAALYNVACAVIGTGGVEILAEGFRQSNMHKVGDGVMSLGICALFVTGNTIAGLKPIETLNRTLASKVVSVPNRAPK